MQRHAAVANTRQTEMFGSEHNAVACASQAEPDPKTKRQ
jgi:hypothetical protein